MTMGRNRNALRKVIGVSMNKSNYLPPHSPWNLDTLAEFLISRINAVEKYQNDLSNEREVRTTDRFNTSKEAVTFALAATKEAISVAMIASEKAIVKAEAASEKRSEASNEIRAAMIDQQKNFADKSQTEFRLGTIEGRVQENMVGISKRLENLEAAMSGMSGRTQGVGVSTGVIFQIVTMLIAVIAIGVMVLHHS